jgi:hypothetical protein
MDLTLVSAISALLGSLIGGSASVATSWMAQKTLNKRELMRECPPSCARLDDAAPRRRDAHFTQGGRGSGILGHDSAFPKRARLAVEPRASAQYGAESRTSIDLLRGHV